jgi:hypothetical protein
MAKQQSRLADRAQLVPISLYPQTIAQLHEIQRSSGESRGAVVRRLVEREADRLRKVGIPKAPVWTFPSYDASGPRIDARVIYHKKSGEALVFEALGERVRPEPPSGSYVVIGEEPERLHGQVEGTETTDVDGLPMLVITVRELVPPAAYDVPPILFDFVHRLNGDVVSRSAAEISFDPNRTTPSWKLGEHEVRAMLVGPIGQRAHHVRFFPFSGPTFQDHLNPVSDYFPVIEIEDVRAREDTAHRIVRFLEHGPAQAVSADQSFLRWAEAVYVLIHDQLGGNASQFGLSRRFGKAAFICAMDYKPEGDRGIAQFVVQITTGLARGRRRTERYAWRDTAATTVAADAIRNYNRLLEDE